jgi:hypothetical protein
MWRQQVGERRTDTPTGIPKLAIVGGRGAAV